MFDETNPSYPNVDPKGHYKNIKLQKMINISFTMDERWYKKKQVK